MKLSKLAAIIFLLHANTAVAQEFNFKGLDYATVVAPSGRIWLDRNLGATKVAEASDDAASYGDLYQFGRAADGHQLRDSGVTTEPASSITPNHNKFIADTSFPHDWVNTGNSVDRYGNGRSAGWQNAGVNDICPAGFAVPTKEELHTATLTVNAGFNLDAGITSFLKLPANGTRNGRSGGTISSTGSVIGLWTRSREGNSGHRLHASDSERVLDDGRNQLWRSNGFGVRCIYANGNTITADDNLRLHSFLYTAPQNFQMVGEDIRISVQPRNAAGNVMNSELDVVFNIVSGDAELAAGGAQYISNNGLYSQNISSSNTGEVVISVSIEGEVANSISILFYEGFVSQIIPFGGKQYRTVRSPTSYRVWLDRNLGADRPALFQTDDNSYGDLYQWGRAADGHQLRGSDSVNNQANSISPGSDKFIIKNNGDWTNSSTDSSGTQRATGWQDGGVNDICPAGFEVPTEAELSEDTKDISNAGNAYGSFLNLGSNGLRAGDGNIVKLHEEVALWTRSKGVFISSSNKGFYNSPRANALAVRCIYAADDSAVSSEDNYNLRLHSTITSSEDTVSGNGVDYATIILQTANATGNITNGGRDVVFDAIGGKENMGEKTLKLIGTVEDHGDGTYSQRIKNTGATIARIKATINGETASAQQIIRFVFRQDAIRFNSLDYKTVISPRTNRIWLDRNLGASRVATSKIDTNGRGFLYQWGRNDDGHEKRDSTASNANSNTPVKPDSNQYLNPVSNNDWTEKDADGSVRETAWGSGGNNDICPDGFGVPDSTELRNETLNNNIDTLQKGFDSFLMLPATGYRTQNGFVNTGDGWYWSKSRRTNGDHGSFRLRLSDTTTSNLGYAQRAYARAIRCIYAGESVNVASSNIAEVIVSSTGINTVEGITSSPRYSIKLSQRPNNNVVVTPSSSNAAVARVGGAITFTPDNWNLPQFVIITILEDNNDYNTNIVQISHSINGYFFGAATPSNVEVRIADNDTPPIGVSLSPRTVVVVEGGTAEYTIKLDSPPTGNVVITPASNSNKATTSGALTFSISNWNIPQIVTITAVNSDSIAPENVLITHTISGGGYGGVGIFNVAVNITETDTASVSLSATTATITVSGVARYTIRLDYQPNGNVILTPISGDPAAAAVTTNGTLTFTTSNWNIPQIVTINAISSAESVTITHGIDGGGYGAANVAEVVVRITERIVSVSLSTTAVAVAIGEVARYTIKLDDQPSGDVTLIPTSGDPAATTSGALTFSTSNWNTPQTVTINGISNAESVRITHNIGSGYRGMVVDYVDVRIFTPFDDDTFSFNGLQYQTILSQRSGKIWLDRNLGASRVAISSTDRASYGDLYQWGRGADGHQLRSYDSAGTIQISSATTDRSSTTTPMHGDFIDVDGDWTSADTAGSERQSAWTDNGTQDICPAGFQPPTVDELTADTINAGISNSANAHDSFLKFPQAGFRLAANAVRTINNETAYWSIEPNSGGTGNFLYMSLTDGANINTGDRAYAISVRCIYRGAANEIISNTDRLRLYSTIRPANTLVATGEQTTVTLQAKDSASNNLSSGGLGVTFNTTGSAELIGTAVDNGDGTYSQDIRSSTAENVVISANIGGERVTANNPIIRFVAPISFGDKAYQIVVSPTTNRIWLDRNLGAERVAIATNDSRSYGDLYQWGRGSNGHQLRTSQTIRQQLSAIENPAITSFIIHDSDWTNADSNGSIRATSWASSNNNAICPEGFQVPSAAEWNAEKQAGISNLASAFSGFLKIPAAGFRNHNSGNIDGTEEAALWSSSFEGNQARRFNIKSGESGFVSLPPSFGFSVRCIKSAIFDIDQSGSNSDSTDTAIVLRYLFGSRGIHLVTSQPLLTPAQIENIQNLINNNITDVDSNGSTDTKDGTMILRYFIGKQDPTNTRTSSIGACPALTTGLADGAGCDATRNRIQILLQQ